MSHSKINFSKSIVFWTLFKKEILRFLSVGSQTLLAPLITASLYLLIFGVSLGKRIQLDTSYSYLDFVIPGLILMGCINNSFANSSSSLFLSKYIGNLVELLSVPIGHMQFYFAYVFAAMIRGIFVASLVFIVSRFFSDFIWAFPLKGALMILLTSFIFASLGLLAALISTSFDTLSMFTNFLILPLIYLGGLFYPISTLPEIWQNLSKLNPIYYLIEGFRYSYIGSGDISFTLCVMVTLGVAIFCYSLCALTFSRGYKLLS